MGLAVVLGVAFTDIETGPVFSNTMMQQYNVGMRWEATNWNGACDELARIAKPTLVITGTDDMLTSHVKIL